MATIDALSLLRTSLAAGRPPSLTTISDPEEAHTRTTESFADATSLYFPYPTPRCLALDTPTRFISKTEPQGPVELRSIFFAFIHKDSVVTDYFAKAAELSQSLPEGQKLHTLPFVEKLELITWLDGGADTSEFIELLSGDAALAEAASHAADAAGPVQPVGGTGVGVTQQTPGGRPVKVIDARLQQIYNGERKMVDHNSVLRGIKPTDFSHVRKHAETFLGRRARGTHPSRPGQPNAKIPSRPAPSISKPLSTPSSSKNAHPIILLSPSASSLLRMSNTRSFLESGLFVPPDHATLSTQTASNVLHVVRPMRSLSEKPFRFIVVDSPEQFKPDYWSRVVAVFTTGQTWQFRSYKWREPQELFGHVLGVFVGEKGLPIPNEVKGWGSAVKSFMVERWDERSHGTNVSAELRENRRWRDREIAEEIWRSIEHFMRSRGSEWKR